MAGMIFANIQVSAVDLGIIVAYPLVIVGIGVFAGFRRSKSGKGAHYFLADNTLTWPIDGGIALQLGRR